MTYNDGGSAFPIPHDDRPGAYVAEPGMSLRDYFAGQAIAVLTRPEFVISAELTRASLRGFASRAYRIADAMLEARAALKEREGE